MATSLKLCGAENPCISYCVVSSMKHRAVLQYTLHIEQPLHIILQVYLIYSSIEN